MRLLAALIVLTLTCGSVPAHALHEAEFAEAAQALASGRYQDALDIWTRLGREGHVGAQTAIGLLFAEGRVVRKDLSKAIKWFRAAAKNGGVEAQYNLGLIRLNESSYRNYDQAYKWFTEAHDQGHVGATHGLGVMYAKGYGRPKNHAKAFAYYSEAAFRGNVDSQFNVGAFLLYGFGVEQNPSHGMAWIHIAAEQGHPGARQTQKVVNKELTAEEIASYLNLAIELSETLSATADKTTEESS